MIHVTSPTLVLLLVRTKKLRFSSHSTTPCLPELLEPLEPPAPPVSTCRSHSTTSTTSTSTPLLSTPTGTPETPPWCLHLFQCSWAPLTPPSGPGNNCLGLMGCLNLPSWTNRHFPRSLSQNPNLSSPPKLTNRHSYIYNKETRNKNLELSNHPEEDDTFAPPILLIHSPIVIRHWYLISGCGHVRPFYSH